MLEDKIQESSDYLFWFSIGYCVVDQRSGDGRFIGRIFKSPRLVAAQNCPNGEMLDAKIAPALNKIIQNSHFKKKVSLEEQKAQKEGQFLRGRRIAFMINDCFWVTGAHDTELDYADLFSVILHDDNVQEFDTRWNEVLLSLSKIPSDDVLESLYSVDDFKSLRSKKGLLSFPEFWGAGCENCIFFEQNHPEFLLQEKCQSGGTESSERGSVLARETDRLHYIRLLSSYWCSWYRTWWRRSTFNYSDDVQEFDATWDEMLLSMTRNPPDDVLESLYKLSIRESAQLKTVLELYDMEIHQKISMPNDQKFEDDGEKEYISEATITKLRCQKW